MSDYEPYYTEDGSIGLYSYADNDVYHSKFGALTEAWEKFIIPSGIDKILSSNRCIKVLDLCYGVGYNTKALMSFIIEKKKLYIKNKSIFTKLNSFVSLYTNNFVFKNDKKESKNIETINTDNNCPLIISIDCIDINEELIKLSPFFKTIKTPGEIFDSIIPKVFTCFDSYYKLRKLYENIASLFYPKNRKDIKELLDIKFKNMHIDKEYKVNGIVNYILLNYMQRIYGDDYFNNELKKLLKDRRSSKFFDHNFIKYAKFNHKFGYYLSSEHVLSTFLHNIYYRHISKRYNNINFNLTEKLFNINFYVNDARKTIKTIDDTYDCIFLDAFTYKKSPQLWSIEFIAELSKHLSDDGIILTYSNSAQIRNTFLENNLYVGKIYNKKYDKFNGTIASKNKLKIKYPLNNYEIGLCGTTAGIPYHDPNLSFSNEEILELREYEFKHSNLMSASKYIKTRSLRGDND